MTQFTITEKRWDDVRPDSVKKTGLSASIRAFAKAVPPSFATLTGRGQFDTAEQALKDLAAALQQAEQALKPHKAADVGNAAANRLKAWAKEVSDGLDDLAQARDAVWLAALANAANQEFDALEKKIDLSLAKGQKLYVELNRGDAPRALVEVETDLLAMQQLAGQAQGWVTKAGFAAWAKTWDVVAYWGRDPKDAPLPAKAKALKTKIDALVKLAATVRDEVETAVKGAGVGGGQAIRQLVQPMVDELRKVNAAMKAAAPKATALLGDAKTLADGLKAGPIANADAAIAKVVALHLSLVRLEEATTRELARVRMQSGDLARALKAGRANAAQRSKEALEEYDKATAEWSGLCFASFRPCSAAFEATANQVNRALGSIAATGSAKAAALPDTLAKRREAAVARYKT